MRLRLPFMFEQPPLETNQNKYCNCVHQAMTVLHCAATQKFKIITRVQTENRPSSLAQEYAYNLFVISKILYLPKGNIEK